MKTLLLGLLMIVSGSIYATDFYVTDIYNVRSVYCDREWMTISVLATFIRRGPQPALEEMQRINDRYSTEDTYACVVSAAPIKILSIGDSYLYDNKTFTMVEVEIQLDTTQNDGAKPVKHTFFVDAEFFDEDRNKILLYGE